LRSIEALEARIFFPLSAGHPPPSRTCQTNSLDLPSPPYLTSSTLPPFPSPLRLLLLPKEHNTNNQGIWHFFATFQTLFNNLGLPNAPALEPPPFSSRALQIVESAMNPNQKRSDSSDFSLESFVDPHCVQNKKLFLIFLFSLVFSVCPTQPLPTPLLENASHSHKSVHGVIPTPILASHNLPPHPFPHPFPNHGPLHSLFLPFLSPVLLNPWGCGIKHGVWIGLGILFTFSRPSGSVLVPHYRPFPAPSAINTTE